MASVDQNGSSKRSQSDLLLADAQGLDRVEVRRRQVGGELGRARLQDSQREGRHDAVDRERLAGGEAEADALVAVLDAGHRAAAEHVEAVELRRRRTPTGRR